MADLSPSEARSKLAALNSRISAFIGSSATDEHERDDVAHFYAMFHGVQATLMRRLPALFGDMPVVAELDEGIVGVTDHGLRILQAEITYCLNILNDIQLDSQKTATVSSEGVFFAGQSFDALAQAIELVLAATESIVLIDGYVDIGILKVLASNEKATELRVLTKQVSLSPATIAAADAFKQQHGRLQLRTSDAFHDRFLIIDGAECYHFGASFKDLGKRGFMFSRLEEPSVVAALSKGFEQAWLAASVVVN